MPLQKTLQRHFYLLIEATFVVMKITIAAATRVEIREELLRSEKHDIQFLYTGVGMLASAVSFAQHVFQQTSDLIVQVGIAGCFDTSLSLGSVVVVDKEYLGDTGVWEDNKWKDLFDLNLQPEGDTPFINTALVNERIDKLNVLPLQKVTGVTINEITTDTRRISTLTMKYKAVIESMEGASLHYVCNRFEVPFLQVRSISNYVGERDKRNWKMKESIANVNEVVKDMIERL